MHTLKTFATVLVAAVLIAGCSLSSLPIPSLSPSPTPVPPTETSTPLPSDTPAPTLTDTAEPTFTAIPTQTGTPTVPPATTITYGNISLLLPASLGTGTTNSTVTDIELPYTNPGGAPMPQHSKLVITGYPIQGALLEPQIMVFPAAQYAQYGDLTGQIVSTLRDVPFMDGQPLPAGLPDGPFNAHVASIAFTQGHGIRYLTQFDQAPLPVNNHEMFYFFHGLTDDGNVYLEAVFPVQAAFLPADENPDSPLPQGGIPFNMDDLGTYFQNISDKLNATPPTLFTPPLTALDALLQSTTVK